MKLSNCKFGRIVVDKNNKKVGMVKGLSQNSSGETIVIVSWANGSECAIHQGNLKIYRG